MSKNLEDQTPDTFVPDSLVRAELDVSTMTLHRWDNDPRLAAIGWPPAMKAPGGRTKKRSRKQLEQFKANLMRDALAARGKKVTT